MPDEAPGPGRPGRAVDEAAAREAEHAARLLGYLRDLARARRRPSRDLADHDHVHWLADLPGDVYVERDAGPGEVLFSVPVIPLTPPVVLEEFDGWLALRTWYRILRDLAGEEVVLAAGLLSWRPAVHDHLLSTPVRIVLDERTERVDVVLDGHTTLRDRELLSGHPGFRPAAWVAEAVQAGQGFGLNASTGDVLRKWCQVSLTTPADFREDWAPGADTASPVPRLRLAPALVVRPPAREAVADHHARLLTLLPRGVPDGLARFVSPGRKPQIMHVPERAPETVPDLLAGLLARGHRVLVATSGPTASADLRAALPPGLAALTATDPAMAARTAEALRARGASPDLALAAGREEAAARRVAETTERLRSGDLDEPAPDPGDDDPELSWMPVRPDLPAAPPISRSEAADLVVLLAEETAARKARTTQRDVDPGALPSAAYVQTLVDAEVAAVERAERSRTELSQRLRDSDRTFLARLDGDASVVAAAFRDLGLEGHPGGWNGADLAARAFGDALGDRRPLIWARVSEMTSRAQWAERALAELSGHTVELPEDADLRGLAASAQDLRTHLAGGGTLKRGPLRPAVQRQAEPLLTTVTVDGVAPTTPELLDLVHTDLMVRITCRELQYVWEAAGISFPADLPPAERVARFVRAHARLARVRDAMQAVDSTRRLLDRSGFGVRLTHPAQWHEYASALRNALESLGVNRAAADLEALRESIGPLADDDPPELRDALAAIDARDAAAYGRALGALAEARHERSRQIRCDELIVRVRSVHPDLANLMIATDGDEVWHARTRRWDDAWAWARRRAAPAVPATDRLHAELASAEEDLRTARADLTAARAWAAAAARASSAPDAVPAWILPLWRVPDVLPPTPDGFDVVIVDGEHEAGAEALHVLWHAPRTILVGPPGPDLPPPEGPPPATRLPSHLHTAITPTTTLFTALTTPPAPENAAPEPRPDVTRQDLRTQPPGLYDRPDITQRDLPIIPRPERPPTRSAPRPPPPPPAREPDKVPRPPDVPVAGQGTTEPAPRAPEKRPTAPGTGEGPPMPRRGRPPGLGGPRERAETPGPAASRERSAPSAPAPGTPGPGVPQERPVVSASGTGPQAERPPAPRRGRPSEGAGARPPERSDVPVAGRGAKPPAAPRDVPVAGRGARGPGRSDVPAAGRGASAPPEGQAPSGTPPEEPGSGSRGQPLPPRRLDAMRRDSRGAAPRSGGGSLPPRRLDAGRLEPHAPEPGPQGAKAPAAREPEPEARPPAPRPDIPALWGKPGPRPEPPAAPPPPQQQQQPEVSGSSPAHAMIRRGQSIAGYKRPELVEIVGHIAEREPELSDEQIVELVTRLMACPEDEALLVGARLRYAVEAYRESAG
ncbi:hypothetical protein [Actinomadura sp. B10D3]|uniref:hypothetical protein n=1 Tax=Actinomadura sp. B10D3 TaxID=3153557 RepID=UPI00325DC447